MNRNTREILRTELKFNSRKYDDMSFTHQENPSKVHRIQSLSFLQILGLKNKFILVLLTNRTQTSQANGVPLFSVFSLQKILIAIYSTENSYSML